MKRRADAQEIEDYLQPMVGSATTLNADGKGYRPPRRAFPPGFAGANPGPSHDEPLPPRRRKPKE